MAATWASSSDPGNAWMRQLTAPVRPEADKGAWPETVADERTALPCWPAQWPYSLGLGSCRCCLLTLLACGRQCTLNLCLAPLGRPDLVQASTIARARAEAAEGLLAHVPSTVSPHDDS